MRNIFRMWTPRKYVTEDPRVTRVEVPRAKVDRVDTRRLTRVRYSDTGEIVVMDLGDFEVFREFMRSKRPTEILGFVE